MAGKLKLTRLPGFDQDIYALPHKVRVMTLERLAFIRDGKLRGERLDNHPTTGDLSDCYKLYFDRYTPNEVAAVALEAVVVGEREALSVYIQALERLNRREG